MVGKFCAGLLITCAGHARGLVVNPEPDALVVDPQTDSERSPGDSQMNSMRSPWETWRNSDVHRSEPLTANRIGEISQPIPIETLMECGRKVRADPPYIAKDNKIGAEGAGEMTQLLTWIFDEVDHIYVICIECEKFAVPNAIAEKTSVIKGNSSDECLEVEKFGHIDKVTAAHKMIAANAQEEKYKFFAVLEEDMVVGPHSHDWLDQGRIREAFNASDGFQIMRLGYMPEQNKWHSESGNCCRNGCRLARKYNTATTEGNCWIWSTVGYIVNQNASQVIIDTPGAIDGEIMNNTKSQFLLDPPILYQSSWKFEFQEKVITLYTGHCGRSWGCKR